MKRNVIIDVFKYLFALGVVYMHSFHSPTTFLIVDGIIKLAVPFFFICSGLFLHDVLSNKNKVYKRVKSYALLYLFWMVIFGYCFIENLEFVHYDGNLLVKVVKVLYIALFAEGYFHLWYLVALIYGILLIYALGKYTPPTTIAVCALFFYLYGLLGDSYSFIDRFNLFAPVRLLWGNTRNCLTYALPFLSLGYFLSLMRKSTMRTKDVIGLCISLVIYFTELYIVRGMSEQSFLFLSTPVVLFFLFRVILSYETFNSKPIIRKFVRTSDLIYFIHPLIVKCVFCMVEPDLFYERLIILYIVIISIAIMLYPLYKMFYSWYLSVMNVPIGKK